MFATLFSGLSFGAPLVLLALVSLPILWWLLRVTPPMPRRVVFPPLRLLLGLKDTKETPARTPLWLLLMRILAAALVIFALAEPMLGKPPELKGSGPLVLLVDNGWPAAQGWDSRAALMTDLLRAAARQGRPVAIEPTADPAPLSLLDAGAAARSARTLVPEPWQPSRLAAANAIRHAHFSSAPDIVWLSDGIEDGNGRATAAALATLGHLTIYGDAPGKGTLAILPPANGAGGFSLALLRAETSGPRDGEIAALGGRDEALASAHFHFDDGKVRATAHIALPLEVRNETVKIAVQNADSAGMVQLLDQGVARRAIGIVSARSAENEQPLLSDTYYLERALTPYADLQKGTISELLSKSISVLVLADIGRITGSDYTAVANFVGKGGLLIRFAGGRMATEADDLVPVKLRTGGRYLGGALAWAEPQHLAPFGSSSPFNGLEIPPDVTVSHQVLAEPSVELADKSWARLQDGTPLVTAARRGNGWIVLFHITASPAWSTLPMSGLYVGMLRRLLALSAGARPNEMANATSMPALETLDGLGHLRKPPAEVLPIRAQDIAKTTPSRIHPPGIYGAQGAGLALNAVSNETVLVPLRTGRSVESYSGTNVVALEPPLLAIATLLLLLDAIISLGLRGHLDSVRRVLPRATAMLFVFVLAMHAGAARADDAFDLKAALDTRLAYVVTGLSDVDDMSKAGLEGLGLALKERTSYEPQEPMGVDIEHDDLSFFPLLYWPMDPREKDLSPQALSKLADYMRNGGTIVFDTRDLTLGATGGQTSPGEQTLRRLLAKLDLPPLQPVPSDHVLTKAFYLLQDFPGRWDGSKTWVEALPPPDPNSGPAPARGGDGVSPVIIGGNDWAAAWAVDSQGRPLVDVVPGGERQRELAIRFGINLVMYAFTGNYKTDQVHVPALLQRLGK